ncbi:unnamed protein product [Allacma fusca]|uniref:Uncharacterized protein n=1 Tax=Allacma fusca TaxID=39272 RepID=A0A8J2PSE3_9HEXA|nr:unnamed protein product [Allacma fusca]
MTSKHKSLQQESKVRRYIETVKKADEESRKEVVKPESMLTLEELYETDKAHLPVGSDITLSSTLRALKEKDMMILKLRQSCSDLTIKCANAENTIDELRFGVGSKPVHNITPVTSRKDASVETDTRILEQPCVDWLEKVQHWRADAIFHTSHEESCGDSGFRGSDLDLKHTANTTIGTNTGDTAKTSLHHSLRTSTSKDVFSLDPLLDEATALAKRVKEKSIRLSEMLKE